MGLSGDSCFLVQVLAMFFVVVYAEGCLPGLLCDYLMCDVCGVLVTGYFVKVVAKIGILNFVSGFGGYVMMQGGRLLVFSILLADLCVCVAIIGDVCERLLGGCEWILCVCSLQ